jgi:hypothetical protein
MKKTEKMIRKVMSNFDFENVFKLPWYCEYHSEQGLREYARELIDDTVSTAKITGNNTIFQRGFLRSEVIINKRGKVQWVDLTAIAAYSYTER